MSLVGKVVIFDGSSNQICLVVGRKANGDRVPELELVLLHEDEMIPQHRHDLIHMRLPERYVELYARKIT